MTTNVLLYEPTSGICGDMHIGAMLDLGVPADHLVAQLRRLPVADEFSLEIAPGKKMGIKGTRVTVQLIPETDRPVRHLADICAIIEAASFPARVRDMALRMFADIAIAEGKIHDIHPNAVHFHEVGATDSIVDIVAAALCLDYVHTEFGVDRVCCTPVAAGSGTVRCAHGILPVPAPATAELLKGIPVAYGTVGGEATTPTGAAILKTALTSFEPPSAFTAHRSGYGIGFKDFEQANVLRLTLGEATPVRSPGAWDSTPNVEISCNIDDMSPESFQPLVDRLFAAGAVEVFMTPVYMKKSRPGTLITTLADEAEADDVAACLFLNSTTIGVRRRTVIKHMLPRESFEVDTALGTARVKRVRLPDGRRRWKVEHDDVVRLAEHSGESYLDARALVDAAVRQLEDISD